MSVIFRFFILSAAFVFSLYAQELLKNNDFSNGLENWGNPSVPQGSISQATSGLFFEIQNGGTNDWDVQMTQSGINIRPGYTYKLTIKGFSNGDSRQILAGIGESGGNFNSHVETICLLEDKIQREYSTVWENSSTTDANSRFFINGGGQNVSFTLISVSVFESKTPGADPDDEFVLVNQVGFYTKGPKIAVLRNGTANTYNIRNNQGKEIWSGAPGATLPYQPSNENLKHLDFSELDQAGTFTFYKNDSPISREFTISDSANKEISTSALKTYYYQRASTEITPEHGGIWQRPAGHMDDLVHCHSSAGDKSFSSPKGWYDAGDYGKYIVNSGISTYTLMLLYLHFPQSMTAQSLNIPESKNKWPDILDEVKWNLDWMLTMQDEDGGVYHKLTSLVFDGDKVMPDESNAERFVFMKTTSASLNFAAVMAQASLVYTEFDQTFASECLKAATDAFSWADSNPQVYYEQPPEVNTGEYGDKYLDDEFYWAAAQLQAASGSDKYESYLVTLPDSIRVPDWQWTAALGLFTIVSNRSRYDSSIVNSARKRLIKMADLLVDNQNCGYKISMKSSDFIWGSNSMAANQGVILLHAYYMTKDINYRNAAVSQLDYLLGRNPLNICYVTGFGQKSPLNPHHRVMYADEIGAPIPGFLVGGPHIGGQDIEESWGCENYVKDPATSYIDNFCSYATNEIAINWNASFCYLSNSLEALFAGEKAAISGDSIPVLKRNLSGSNSAGIILRETANGSKIQFTFNSPGTASKPMTVSMFNLTGKKVFSKNITQKRTSFVINKSLFGNGIFIVKVSDGKTDLNKRLIIK